MRVGVYLVHWHQPDWCAEAAQSIVASTVSAPIEFSCTVIDNGGGEVLATRLPVGVDVVGSGGNLGYSGGANAGFRLALEREQTYVAVASHDVIVEPDAIAALGGGLRVRSCYWCGGALRNRAGAISRRLLARLAGKAHFRDRR